MHEHVMLMVKSCMIAVSCQSTSLKRSVKAERYASYPFLDRSHNGGRGVNMESHSLGLRRVLWGIHTGKKRTVMWIVDIEYISGHNWNEADRVKHFDRW